MLCSKPSDGRSTHTHEDTYLLPLDSFDHALIDPPKVDRASLGWDVKLIGQEILFLYGKRGCVAWESGKITGYNKEKLEHRVKPADGSDCLKQNLLACSPKVFKEWRFLVEGEDAEATCGILNAS